MNWKDEILARIKETLEKVENTRELESFKCGVPYEYIRDDGEYDEAWLQISFILDWEAEPVKDMVVKGRERGDS